MTHAETNGASSDPPLTADLLQQARSGDQHAQRELVLRFSRPLERFLHARLPGRARGLLDTDDVVQETLVAAIARLDGFESRGVGSFWSYLRKIGLNLVAQARRRELRGGVGREDVDESRHAPPARDGDPLASLLRRERVEVLDGAIARLPTAQREALLLWMELELSYEEIAVECGFPSRDAARMSIYRALEALASHLSRSEDAE